MSILSSVAKSIGVDTLLPVIEEIELPILVQKGHDEIIHFFTIPAHLLDTVASKTGADLAKVHAAAAAFAVAGADLIASFAPRVETA